MDKQTLKEIFKRHGLDPFDAFLMHESEWPEEAQELMRKSRETECETSAQRVANARASVEWSERRDRYEEPD